MQCEPKSGSTLYYDIMRYANGSLPYDTVGTRDDRLQLILFFA